MDLIAVIGLVGSLLTIEEASSNKIAWLKKWIGRKGINIDQWNAEDSVVQACLDKFKTSMVEKYKEHIFSDMEIEEIVNGFFYENSTLRIGQEEKTQIKQLIKELISTYNTYVRSLMSPGEKVIYDAISTNYDKITYKIDKMNEKKKIDERQEIIATKEDKFRIDKTGQDKHFNLFSSNIPISVAFVDNCFEYYYYQSNLDSSIPKPIDLKRIIDLVVTNNLIFIEGEYGSGKTVLTTMIQLKLKDKYKTMFFSVEDFCDNASCFEAIKQLSDKCFVFIDGVDKLVDSNINLDDLNALCNNIKDVIQINNHISFVLNSRMFCWIDAINGRQNELVSMNVMAAMQRDNLIVIKTNGFKNKEYEVFFENINIDKENNANLTANTIKQWHKKSPISCEVPLFAYVIGTYYYEKQREIRDYSDGQTSLLPNNKMIIYDNFIEKTIKGRFREENIHGTVNENLYENYASLLQRVAVKMIFDMQDNIDYMEDVSQTYEFSNKEIYAIDIKEFDVEMQNQLTTVYENCKKEILLSDAINNYFFCIYKTSHSSRVMVRFSDINVMCCFAADYIYGIIMKIVKFENESEIKSNFPSILAELGLIELQPQVMDFLVCKIYDLNSMDLDSLLSNILICINIYYNQKQTINENSVRAMLVLYIVFIKFYKNSYKTINALYLFKSFYRLCMTAKAININGEHVEGKHRYLAERYFMNCSFIECQFKRLNYKYYNFTNAEIISSSFKQCNFLNNEFVGTKIKNTDFELCTIKTKFEKTKIEGEVKIKNSILNSVILEKIASETGGIIYLFGCTIPQMKICNIDNKRLKFVFENCILTNIDVTGCKGMVINIKKCVGENNVNVDVHSEIYSENPQLFNGTVKSLEYLQDDDFRKI